VQAVEPVSASSLAWAAFVVLGFYAVLFVGALMLPGRWVEGFPQPDGARKTYKVNGTSLWVMTHFVIIAGTLVLGLSLAPLRDRFWSLFIVLNVLAVVWTVALNVQGRRKLAPEQRAHGLTARVAELWLGSELNPTWLGVDLKVWAYHPSLIGMSLLHASFAYAQWESHGTLTPQMIAYQAFWWCYMTTHYRYEPGVLSMWDVIAEKFGFMLLWGDVVLVPFFYSLGGWYLVDQVEPMPTAKLLLVCALFGTGLWIFRGANAQKDRFKRDRSAPIWGKPPELLGGRLLVSGWWGIGRKLNYTGEIMVYLSFALCTGNGAWAPYLLPLWLCVLLSHRAWRDEQRCRAKYGELWDAYTKRARFRMLPFLY
jgi:Delta14-sterol reductase